jgi:hypothetical protein
MLVHTSLFRFKPDTPSSVIDEIEDAFKALGTKLPYIRKVFFARNGGEFEVTRAIAARRGVAHLKPGYDLIVIIHFDSIEDYHRYSDDDDHWAIVGELLVPNQQDRASIQYVTPDS